MTTASDWVQGARPRTLPAAAAPVLVGTGAAAQLGEANLGRAALALGVALALQVGVNYANDYSDGIRGTDVDRVGPLRLTASGTASPGTVKGAAFAAFGVAALLGLALVALSGQWWLLAVGALAIAAAWGYTGGKRPYGYRGLGEVGVFVFFGLVAVLGTTYTQADELSWPAWVGAVAVGMLACALLMANNLRDVPTDALVGKRTLAVRLGERRSRQVYAALVVLPVLLGGVVCAFASPWALLVLLLLAPAVVLAVTVLLGARGKALVPVLAGTGMLELGFGVLLGLGLAL
ncbi:1,4-dihydroxy-2-naphthoate polyprenyltransferase [Cellulomonas sp. ICMP 17802]|uniref:1,4-dihydroxy-2-naphthoate polyprenyltransferase n=1 Tax=Cellulomonas sp. ICMP 17802 TaxID=3239199 RepID=UPI00351AF72C